VHHAVGLWRVRGCSELGERVELKIAAEDVLVELDRVAGVAVEADVRVEARDHGPSFVE
jgi:hypothetical protein